MKKFTGNFLLGEHSFGNVLRKVGLSMVAILITVFAFGQPQDTYHVWAENADDVCYQFDNKYEVDILMRDFVKISKFKLVLKYDATKFSYAGVSYRHPVLAQGGAATVDVVESPAGTLTFNWDVVDPVANGTIEPNNDILTTITLDFVLDDAPFVYGPSGGNEYVFSTSLKWKSAAYWDEDDDITDILTEELSTDGVLTVTEGVKVDDIEMTYTDAYCDGSFAVATVSLPAGDYAYSFNGSTFTTNPSTDVLALTDPVVQTVQIATSYSEVGGEIVPNCVSYIYEFTVEAPDPLEYDVESPVYVNCPGGFGDIEIVAEGGTAPYTYYVIPEATFEELELTKGNWEDKLAPFARHNSVVQVLPGTYMVAVNDANGCNAIEIYTGNGEEEEGAWLEVVVIDDKEPFWTETEVTNLQCNDQPEGKIDIVFHGGTPFEDNPDTPTETEVGYKVWFNDTYKGMVTELHLVDLAASAGYDLVVQDANGCDWDTTIVVEEPDPIVFDLTHTDTGCELDNGTITLDWANITGGTFASLTGTTYEGSMAYWAIDTLPNYDNILNEGVGGKAPVWKGDLDEVAEGLPAGVYYVMVFDENGCYNNYINDQGDDAVKILLYDIELTYDDNLCEGETTDVTAVLLTGDGNHDLRFRILVCDDNWVAISGAGTPWQEENTFEDYGPGKYKMVIRDYTVPENEEVYCQYVIPFEIFASDLKLSFVHTQTLPPTCPGNTDGNITLWAWDGVPFVEVIGGVEYEYYEFKMDEGDWIQGSKYNAFAIDTAGHWFTVKDADGCEKKLWFDWPNNENKISFVDTIYNACADAEVNLFNRWPEMCRPTFPPQMPSSSNVWSFWSWRDLSECEEEIDPGYMNWFESEWYGIPIEHFTGTITFDVSIWTSDSGWVTVPLQGIQQFRNPVLYITDVDPEGDAQAIVDGGEVIAHNSAFGAGIYWVVAMDEWGCFSNVEKIVILDPPALDAEVSVVDAGCAGSTDGKIMIEAFNGIMPIPFAAKPFARYQYLLTQQPQIFTHENWVEEVTWITFSNPSYPNDSVGVINVQDGTYWIAVRDYCSLTNEDLIWFSGPVVVGGADPVEVAGNIQDYVTEITCNIWDDDEEEAVPSNDGAITGLLAATTGGYGDYEFTLDWESHAYCEDEFTEKSAAVATGRWPETNKTGDFVDLPAGVYTLHIEDGVLGCWVDYEVVVCEPKPLRLQTVVVNPSCYDAHDGILRYKISGGRAPFMEATNNIAGAWEDASDIPANRWVETTSEAVPVDAHEQYIFDRRVRAGEYDIWIKDANGCIYHIPEPVVVEEPAMLDITNVVVKKVSCNTQDGTGEGTLEAGNTGDGCITFTPVGGWDMEDDFTYYAELYLPDGPDADKLPDLVASATFDQIEDLTWDNTLKKYRLQFCGLKVGDYTIKLYEYSDAIAAAGSGQYANPIISYVDYFEDHTWLGFTNDQVDDNLYQNPFLLLEDTEDACFTTYEVSVGEPDPITYDVQWIDVKCHNTHTGQIVLTNISGGTPGPAKLKTGQLNGYWVGLEGPADYDPSLQTLAANVESMITGSGENEIVWFETVNDAFTFNNLIWGHYTIHIQDANGCWIYKESGEIENQELLVIDHFYLRENVKCNGDTTGLVHIVADGGVPPYEYAVGPANFDFEAGDDKDAYFESLVFSGTEDSINVPAGVWIAYVRDAMGCIVGFSTDMNGQVVPIHRVTVLEPDPVEAGDFDQIAATCHGVEDGKITIDELWGGNGGAWRVDVWGTDWKGDPVSKVYTDITSAVNVVLNKLPASVDLQEVEDEDDLAPEDWYTIVVYDSEGCVSEMYYQYVLQPAPFVIDLKSKQDAFICPGELSGLFEIDVVSGGNPFGVDALGEDQYMYKWEAYNTDPVTDENAEPIDELSDDEYGFVKTFLGYAGYYYRVFAIDALGCETTRDTFIVSPDAIEFNIKDITCWNDPKASAKVTATMTNGRKWHVLYKEIEGESGESQEWEVYNGWAQEGETIVMSEMFVYDTENINDVHYEYVIEDSLGCRSEVAIMTYDIVQHELMIHAAVTTAGECTSEVGIEVTGGTDPYIVTVNGTEVTGMVQTLEPGDYAVVVVDANECMAAANVTVVADPVERTMDVETYIGEEVAVVDAEAGIDTMLAEGVHVFTYTHTNGCERTLTVTVTGVPRVLTIIEVQGEADASPWVDAVVEVAGTVTGVAPGEGFFMQDANAAWSGIWVEYSAATTGGIQIGNGVKVVGTVAEVASVTTLQATSVALVTPLLTVQPIVLAAPSDAETEMYESVLVRVEGARATAADAGSGEWIIYYETTDDVVVNDWLYSFTPEEGKFYPCVNGIVNARLDAFKLEPRVSSDICVPTGLDNTINTTEFKVYPNPFNDRIMIDNNDKLTRVVISNVAGQRVIDVEYPSHEIRTANLVSGVYVVSLFTEDGIAKTERIVKR